MKTHSDAPKNMCQLWCRVQTRYELLKQNQNNTREVYEVQGVKHCAHIIERGQQSRPVSDYRKITYYKI